MLAKIAKNRNYRKIFTIQRIDELNPKELSNLESVAITAGASTPQNIINETNAFLKAYNLNTSVKPEDYLSDILI